MKTIMPKQVAGNERKWFVVDAKGKTLWRLATSIAVILKWKNKADYAPHVDNWDNVIVLNANQFAVTWKKLEDKIYYSHTWYLGGLKEISLGRLLEKKPTLALKNAINGMLPKNKLRQKMISRLKLVVWTEHEFKAQQPEELSL